MYMHIHLSLLQNIIKQAKYYQAKNPHPQPKILFECNVLDWLIRVSP